MVKLDILTTPAISGELASSREQAKELNQYPSQDDTPSYPSEPLLSQKHKNPSRSPQQHHHKPLVIRTLGWSWNVVDTCYNRISAWLFPNEPEPIDLRSTIFFVSQAPIIAMVACSWIPTFLSWVFGMKTSQAGVSGIGRGMRRDWSFSLAFALSFLQSYLRYAEHLTIEECQGRSRSIPFMTAPAGIRINKVKIPSFPYRSRAEAMLYDCLSDQEREILSFKRNNNTRQKQDGSPVTTQQKSDGIMINSPDDQFAEGIDGEWLEYVGPDEVGAEQPNSSNVAAILYLHGGGYYTGSKEEHRVMIGPLVKRLGKNIRILNINYRLAPQSPFPAALVDALSTYMWLLDQSVSESFSLKDDGLNTTFQPNQIFFMGDSAGGGLALSLSLLLRDHGSLPQPLSIVTWSPWLDLTQSLPSFKENALTDCIPYEGYIHKHSEVIDKMFEQQELGKDESKPRIRQRAQVYCPDSCLRMKYVSPLFETDFSGIPSIFITCGSAERFSNECIMMAAKLEQQQQPCRIDIHEDMPHVFPLFRFHPSAVTALDRTCSYIREVFQISRSRNDESDVIIPISLSSSASSSRSSSPALPPDQSEQQRSSLEFDGGVPSNPRGLETVDNFEASQTHIKRPRSIHRQNSLASITSTGSEESASSSSPSLFSHVLTKGKQVMLSAPYSKVSAKDMTEPTTVSTTRPAVKIRTVVNVIDLFGSTVLSFHRRDRYGPCDAASSTRRRRRSHLTLRDIVSDETLHEWETLLNQGYIPTRQWPFPPLEKN
ncbi:hypothetical protein BGZ46_009966 [Entomortierella lignicola]|nr:hypothetical protein BGZ46_009966 [Entomortierella lignicola]